ncbi:MAG: 4-(cytidine 5'-diphospho)-2-C-methyl-D-erythritol kinase [Solirubrobacteraceae bacterium]
MTPDPLPLRVLAPAKVNLGLFLGPTRNDGRHELVSVMQSISLADELTLEGAPPGVEGDEVLCEGVGGENLAARALELFRDATGWERWVRLRIDKRIPVAAGLGGGSADAAATLRLAREASGLGDEELLFVLARELGADVPAQVVPGRWLATGAGEVLEELPDPVSPVGVLVLPQAVGLSTAEVYARADRLGIARDAYFMGERLRALRRALELGTGLPTEECLLHNDLQRASLELCPAIERALEQAVEVGADVTFVSGSGPTVVGLFARANALARAQRAAAGLRDREPAPLVGECVGKDFARVQRLGA